MAAMLAATASDESAAVQGLERSKRLLTVAQGEPLIEGVLDACTVYDRRRLRGAWRQPSTWADVDLDAGVVHVTKAWNYEDEINKAPKTRNGVRRVPIEPTLAPLLGRMRKGKEPSHLVVPALCSVPDNSLAEIFASTHGRPRHASEASPGNAHPRASELPVVARLRPHLARDEWPRSRQDHAPRRPRR
jgi:hypothetical protein